MALFLMLGAQSAGSNQSDVEFHAGALEVVNVTDHGFALAWYTGNPTEIFDMGRAKPVPSDTVVRYGTVPDPAAWTEVRSPEPPTAYHYVEVDGLEPDTEYWVEASSNGVRAVDVSPGKTTVRTPMRLRTLPRPAGNRVARLVVSNDTHVGESISGEAVRGWPPGFPVDPLAPYWRHNTADLVEEAEEVSADALIVNGDLTSEARPHEVEEFLDIIGEFPREWRVTRGNHDRAHSGPTWDTCTPVPEAPEYHDCLADGLGTEPGAPLNWTADVGPLRLVGIDSNDVYTGAGAISETTAAFLESALGEAPERPAVVFLHHPATWQSIQNWVVWPRFMLPAADVARLQSVLAAHDNVAAVFSGHTHRNYRSASPTLPGIVFQEVGATKEHMGGYGVLDVYEGGLVYGFHKLDCAQCLVWSERTRRQYFGFYGHVVQGDPSDRAFAVVYN